jgi:hypothetical protein
MTIQIADPRIEALVIAEVKKFLQGLGDGISAAMLGLDAPAETRFLEKPEVTGDNLSRKREAGQAARGTGISVPSAAENAAEKVAPQSARSTPPPARLPDTNSFAVVEEDEGPQPITQRDSVRKALAGSELTLEQITREVQNDHPAIDRKTVQTVLGQLRLKKEIACDSAGYWSMA